LTFMEKKNQNNWIIKMSIISLKKNQKYFESV